MCNYGHGFTMMDLYKMPTKLRLFYYNKLVETKTKENEQIQKQNSQPKAKLPKVRINR
jgi:hypothetical protein